MRTDLPVAGAVSRSARVLETKLGRRGGGAAPVGDATTRAYLTTTWSRDELLVGLPALGHAH